MELDDADYQAILKEAEAALSAAQAEYAGNQDAKRAADASVAAALAGIEQLRPLYLPLAPRLIPRRQTLIRRSLNSRVSRHSSTTEPRPNSNSSRRRRQS